MPGVVALLRGGDSVTREREPRCPRCVTGILGGDHTDLECAVELVSTWLADHGHHDLAGHGPGKD